MEKKYTEANITSLSQKEWIEHRIFNQIEIDYLALIYGIMLNPPMSSRKNEDSISIHFFFVDEFKIAKTFEKICEKLIDKLNLDNDLKLIKSETGHFEIESKSLSTYLKKINFEEKMSIFEAQNYFSIEKDINENLKFSYLLGEYIRFYRDGKFVIIEGWNRYVIMDIIESFCIDQDKLESKRFFGVPGTTHFVLNENSTLIKYLEVWKKEMEK